MPFRTEQKKLRSEWHTSIAYSISPLYSKRKNIYYSPSLQLYILWCITYAINTPDSVRTPQDY